MIIINADKFLVSDFQWNLGKVWLLGEFTYSTCDFAALRRLFTRPCNMMLHLYKHTSHSVQLIHLEILKAVLYNPEYSQMFNHGTTG